MASVVLPGLGLGESTVDVAATERAERQRGLGR
jgi:hypothetical protein